MKKFIVLFVIMTASVFSQSWNTVVQTTIPFSSASKVDLTTNRDGNHILVTYADYPTYYLRYYLVNSSGSVVRNYTFENQAVQFANIDGDNDRIYVVYKMGNQIKTRKSTNAGQSWINIEDINIGNNICNNIDIIFGKDDNALHIVWATQDAGSEYKTYYRRLFNDSWSSTENVTDGSNVGGFPTVSKSSNRVHVSYNTGQSWDPETNLGEAKSRDKYINTWQTPQLVYTPQSFRERIHASNSKLFDFYYKLETGMGQYHADLYVKERSLGNTSWSSPQLLKQFSGVREIVSAANTVDGKTHIVYEIYDGVGYRNYNGSSWSSEEQIGSGYISPRIYSVSNDLFVVWGRDFPSQNKFVHYRQYNAAPLAPKDFAVIVYYTGDNSHPKIQWTLNNEPDVREASQGYVIWRKVNQGSYSQIATVSGGTSSYIDYGISYAGSGPNVVSYKIKARDKNNNESGFTNEVSIQWGDAWKIVGDKPLIKEFKLFDNYPNPFNPSTKISWQSPVSGWQTLKVYDVLGNEVATLVDEYREAGRYEVEFSAVETRRGLSLSSGIYFYRLTAGSFTEVKKMILSK
ncbi:T9SS type A sorting domain-containing protein [Ignavibacterium album]|uniref:T9SS type A sorting domain-containing protein n=1 Tax=Ignavibacterium album TaxID=591197 RepID=UPI0035BA84E0